ncbi:hypothetical protein N431DRAFT_325025 [Stipitochalara longipes BDJ]|nr:hypothetical protein N431DRAFT_325025 [Stipitochalara longipes BDJ]
MGGRTSDITLGFVIITFPMLIFAGVLLGLVFHYRVTHNDLSYANLQVPGATDEPGIYYVNLNVSTFTFIASWSSTLAPMLVGFVLALAAYPICRQYMGQARGELLTPYQLALTLRFMNGGGFGAMWSWFKYHFSWRKVRVSQSRTLGRTAVVAVLATGLAYAVFLADTWLHVTTKSVIFTQVLPVATTSDYSLSLIPNCTLSNNSLVAPDVERCSIIVGGSSAYFVNPTQSLQVLNNVSEVTTVFIYESNLPYTYLGIPQDQVQQMDYTASTFGMTTQCKPISTECNLNPHDGGSTPWYCADTWQGDLGGTEPSWSTAYFTDPAMRSNDTGLGVPNPYYWGYAALIGAGTQNAGLVSGNHVPEIIGVTHGGIAFVLLCAITLYDIEYDSVNGSVTRFVAKASNESVANIWQIPPGISGDHGASTLLQAAELAIFSSNAQELADKIALAYSRSSLALGAQSVMRTPALAAQQRRSFIVARVPAAPLFTLIITNLLFAGVGVILTSIAFRASRGDVREVQARLSIVGLVADSFEGMKTREGVENMEDYFEEKEGHDSKRVAINKNDAGGFAYTVWPKTE